MLPNVGSDFNPEKSPFHQSRKERDTQTKDDSARVQSDKASRSYPLPARSHAGPLCRCDLAPWYFTPGLYLCSRLPCALQHTSLIHVGPWHADIQCSKPSGPACRMVQTRNRLALHGASNSWAHRCPAHTRTTMPDADQAASQPRRSRKRSLDAQEALMRCHPEIK